MSGVTRLPKTWLLVAVVTAVVLAVLLAPIITVTSYGDAAEDSVTLTEQRSLVGFATSPVLWLSVTAVALAVVALAALVASRVGRLNSREG